MDKRDQSIRRSRKPMTDLQFSAQMSDEEFFQNKTLRPVIDLQQFLLVDVFKNYVKKYKNVFYELSIENKMDYIENAIQKDMKFRNILKGIIIGQFTLDEYQEYIANSSALNKRMMLLVKEHLQDNLQLLDLAS